VFEPKEVIELLKLAGKEVGLGCKRPDRKTAASKPDYGFGTFSVRVL
jgi:hypothetical protein